MLPECSEISRLSMLEHTLL